jgi:hypothetical protein
MDRPRGYGPPLSVLLSWAWKNEESQIVVYIAQTISSFVDPVVDPIIATVLDQTVALSSLYSDFTQLFTDLSNNNAGAETGDVASLVVDGFSAAITYANWFQLAIIVAGEGLEGAYIGGTGFFGLVVQDSLAAGVAIATGLLLYLKIGGEYPSTSTQRR